MEEGAGNRVRSNCDSAGLKRLAVAMETAPKRRCVTPTAASDKSVDVKSPPRSADVPAAARRSNKRKSENEKSPSVSRLRGLALATGTPGTDHTSGRRSALSHCSPQRAGSSSERRSREGGETCFFALDDDLSPVAPPRLANRGDDAVVLGVGGLPPRRRLSGDDELSGFASPLSTPTPPEAGGRHVTSLASSTRARGVDIHANGRSPAGVLSPVRNGSTPSLPRWFLERDDPLDSIFGKRTGFST